MSHRPPPSLPGTFTGHMGLWYDNANIRYGPTSTHHRESPHMGMVMGQETGFWGKLRCLVTSALQHSECIFQNDSPNTTKTQLWLTDCHSPSFIQLRITSSIFLSFLLFSFFFFFSLQAKFQEIKQTFYANKHGLSRVATWDGCWNKLFQSP